MAGWIIIGVLVVALFAFMAICFTNDEDDKYGGMDI